MQKPIIENGAARGQKDAVFPISAVVFCIDAENVQGVCDTAKAILAQNGGAAECIVADAAGGLLKRLQKQSDWNAQLSCSVRFADMSDAVYETAAQVKNAAVRLAEYDTVLAVAAGTKLPKDFLARLMSEEAVCVPERFERYAQKTDVQFSSFAVSRRALSQVGGWNAKLAGGEDYELLLRMCSHGCGDGLRMLEETDETKPVYMETYQTYAYVLGKYKERFRQSGAFDRIFTARYEEAVGFGIQDYFVKQAEEMIAGGEAFVRIDRETRPILVLKGQDVCYGVLDVFADAFTEALQKCGAAARIVDVGKNDADSLIQLFKMPCRAVVGFQSAVFTEQIQGYLFGNLMNGLKFNFIFDHPLYISYHLMMPLKNYYVLAQDTDYAAYVKTYIENVKNAWHLPPAGQRGSLALSGRKAEKKYGISFIGTYNDYRKRLAVIRKTEGEERKLALRLLLALRKNLNLPIEEVFCRVLEAEGMQPLEKREFAVRMHKMMEAGRAVIFYYREKVIRTLLMAGIELHVFSDSWKESPLARFPNLKIHENVSYEESLNIMAESKLSLNIMSWHKGGMTERIANAMLNGSVCVTDWTSYLEQHFCDGKDLILFDLERMEELPQRICTLLAPENEEMLEQIAKQGFENAWENHRWENRANDFMKILEETET